MNARHAVELLSHQKRICNNNISLHGFVHSDYPINFDSSQSFIQYLLAIICEQCVLITTLWLILLFLLCFGSERKLGSRKSFGETKFISLPISGSQETTFFFLSLSKHQFHKRQSFPREEKTIKQEIGLDGVYVAKCEF